MLSEIITQNYTFDRVVFVSYSDVMVSKIYNVNMSNFEGIENLY